MKKFGFITILILLLLTALYIWFYYFNERSSGTRTGSINKLSRKGDIFKTYEGEMIQSGLRSLSSNTFYFSILNTNIYDSLEKLSRTSKVVTVHYTQYRKTLPWRGENYSGKNSSDNQEEGAQYIVDRIESVVDPVYQPQPVLVSPTNTQ